MVQYEIVETYDGLTVAEIPHGVSPEEAARRRRGAVIDPGPYPSYDDAYEAMMALKLDEEEDLD
ncbi:MAG: hypothetical protein JXB10_02445 [Pirellulales bacterium]|nr:hypothetical protein [Pirellulales bacterium]